MIDKKGKIKLLVSVFIIVLIGMFLFLSAVNTNTKTYDDINKVVTIKSSSGEILSDITLNTPQVFSVIRGNDRKVAEFTIDNKLTSQSISSVLENLDFYNVKDSMKKFDRQFTYKYKNSLGFKTVNDYETVCVDKTSQNGTISKDCSQVLTGTHQEEMFGWANLNSLGEIPSGKTTIGIFTDVYPNERVEWVPTFLGVEVNEWAEWTESLNTDLQAYYKLDRASGVVLDSLGINNGTNNNSLRNVTGIIDRAFEFNGVNTSVDFASNTSIDDIFDGGGTISLWMNSTYPGHKRMLDKSNNDAFTEGFSFYAAGSVNDVYGILFGKGFSSTRGIWQQTTDNINNGVWTHVVITYNSNSTSNVPIVYVNGSSVAMTTELTPVGTTKSDATFNLLMGKSSVADYFTGTIDEVGIWNRTLNSSEISDLFNNGNGITYTNVFQKPPTTPVQSFPANNSNFAIGSFINFTWSNSTDPNGDTITYDLEIYNESDMAAANLIHSNTSITEGSDPTFININLSVYTTTNDVYYWRVRANDSTEVSNWSDTWQFQYASWDITFNLTDGDTGAVIDTTQGGEDFDIVCNNGFSATDAKNNDVHTNFGSGVVECTFSNLFSDGRNYFDKTINITADNDNQVIEIPMSRENTMTKEEHDWLEAIHNCMINGVGCASWTLN